MGLNQHLIQNFNFITWCLVHLTHIIIIIIINIITAIIAEQIYIELDKGNSREKTGETKGRGVTS